MLLDEFIGKYVAYQNKRYLQFDENTTTVIPDVHGNGKGYMLYLHIPFCEKLCNYCSFHRITFRENLAKKYFVALKKEILLYKEKGYDFKALCIGGGTPTVLIKELVETIQLTKDCFDIREITVETNPNHLEMDILQPLKDVGVDRLSVGIQSFNDDILRATERYDKYGSGAEIADKIKSLNGFFKTLNADMIFNFPLQNDENLQADLDILKTLGVDQITYYPLMVSTSTKKVVEKKLGVVNDIRGRRFYELICKNLNTDYDMATSWCFTKKHTMIDEYIINYDEYAGLGSGAIGFIEGMVYANTFDIPEYIKRVEAGEFPIAASRVCNVKSQMLYDFMMAQFGLSFDLNHMSKKYGVNAKSKLFLETTFFRMVGGLKEDPSNPGKFSVEDRYYGVIMMREFFTAVNNFRDYCRAKSNQELMHS
ncbi:MAG: coproporphyrinogen oxidase [Bacillales bacterium]|nr:coproporphyrinogen oxidase [Bacillales bacterium]